MGTYSGVGVYFGKYGTLLKLHRQAEKFRKKHFFSKSHSSLHSFGRLFLQSPWCGFLKIIFYRNSLYSLYSRIHKFSLANIIISFEVFEIEKRNENAMNAPGCAPVGLGICVDALNQVILDKANVAITEEFKQFLAVFGALIHQLLACAVERKTAMFMLSR